VGGGDCGHAGGLYGDLDTTIVNVALPHVAGSLSASYDESTWVLTSYLVANGIVLPISAFLSRVFGRKQFFLICIVMFTVCSFLCGIATELWQIILFRVMQVFLAAACSQRSSRCCWITSSPRIGKAFGLSRLRSSLPRNGADAGRLDHR
jgi:DHA2 family multidrug resistance protein